jgi:predicted amino acid racemase
MNRQNLIERLKTYDATNVPEVGHSLEMLESSSEEEISNDEIGDVCERVSKAIDHKYSDDENHDAWKLEAELVAAYKR